MMRAIALHGRGNFIAMRFKVAQVKRSSRRFKSRLTLHRRSKPTSGKTHTHTRVRTHTFMLFTENQNSAPTIYQAGREMFGAWYEHDKMQQLISTMLGAYLLTCHNLARAIPWIAKYFL